MTYEYICDAARDSRIRNEKIKVYRGIAVA